MNMILQNYNLNGFNVPGGVGTRKSPASAEATKGSFADMLNNKVSSDMAEKNPMDELRKIEENIYNKVINGETEPEIQTGANAYSASEWNKIMSSFDEAEDAIKEEQKSRIEKFKEMTEGKSQHCPYDSFAKDGIIEYNGVVFNCDYKSNSITLGDMSDPTQVLNINLPSGGHLKVNYNNIGDLQNAIGMFSPEDVNAILRKIAEYEQYTSKLEEAEDKEFKEIVKENE